MNDTEGWGSQPIQGKDWGISIKCDDQILRLLTSRFEELCGFDGSRDSMGSFTMFRRSSNALEFDVEAKMSVHDDGTNQNEFLNPILSPFIEKRMIQKRISAFNKRRRMSLWASATQNILPYVPGKKSKFRGAGKSLCPFDDSYRSFTELTNCLSEVGEEKFPSFDKLKLSETFSEESIIPAEAIATNEKIVSYIFSFLTECDLLRKGSGICTSWADLSTEAHANLMMASVGVDYDDDVMISAEQIGHLQSVSRSMERSWKSVQNRFPWACYLAEGGAKRVFKVFNKSVGSEEAISVMDTFNIQSKQIIANELAVSALLSSLARRGICPNFVITRGIFSCDCKPPDSHWGTADNRQPQGPCYLKEKKMESPREAKTSGPGRYQYIRMELINEGDAEEVIRRHPLGVFDVHISQVVLFQIAFALHAAADRFSVKHYDIKLLNVFLQKINESTGDVVMRYGMGSHVFALRMPPDNAFVAKLADFGTANINAESNGQPVTIAQFTTLENTPPDFMILGDAAKQGHGHDHFGLGLCMLHLFTGDAPYEEILDEVKCPTNFKKRLRNIWESDEEVGYNVVSSLIHDGVVKDEAGHVIEGEPDETLYDTLYRFLVLFGVPAVQFQQKKCPKVWKAISDSFGHNSIQMKPTGRPSRRKVGSDFIQFKRDSKKFSILNGTNKSIARARHSLESIHGGIDLLFNLCSFDPATRASALEVLNSPFMERLREEDGISVATFYGLDTTLYEYTAFSTQQHQRKTA
jgi:serine/threonine protein kinase